LAGAPEEWQQEGEAFMAGSLASGATAI
jgi:hypothetical protein